MDGVVDRAFAQESVSVPHRDGRRIGYIDTLRGLASVQVLLSHGMLAFFPSIALASPASRTVAGYLAATPLFFAIDGASAVCIFFILSGYVLTPLFTHSQAASGLVISSRFLRLGIPAIAGCAFSAAVFQGFAGQNVAAADVMHVHWLADGWRPGPDLWFLSDALVNGILLGYRDSSLAQWFGMPATSLAPMANSYVTPLWTLSIEFYGSILVLLLARSGSRSLLVVSAILLSRTYVLCFIAGHVAARLDLGGKRALVPWPVGAAVIALGIGMCMASHFWTPGPMADICAWSSQLLPPCPLAKPDYLLRVYGAIVLTIGITQCAPLRGWLAHGRLSALGRLSFPIYLTHWPVIFGIGSFALLALIPWVGLLPARFLALFVSVAVAAVAAMCFEPVDQVALRVSRAWRGQKPTCASIVAEPLP